VNIFLYNTRGRVVPVPVELVAEKKKLGWDLLPVRFLNDKGEPKQTYFPQLDRDLTGKSINLTEDEERKREVLNVEIL